MDLWRQFADLFVSESLESLSVTDSVIRELQEIDPDFCVTEGGQQVVTHVVKERDRSIVLAKKAQALKGNKLFCEVCTFSFQAVNSANYIECHLGLVACILFLFISNVILACNSCLPI